MRAIALLILLPLVGLSACTSRVHASAATPIVGLPCEDCQVALEGLPEQPPSTARLAPDNAAGEPLRLTGRVLDTSGQPRPGVIVYAYQTDHSGIYPRSDTPGSPEARRHGRLRAWASSDASGRYTFHTIRPGGYPGTDIPQHIHLHVIQPGCQTYYIDDVQFRDDPRLTERMIARMDVGRGGSGIVSPTRRDGVWQAHRDIILGQNIPGHRLCKPETAVPWAMP